MTPAEKEILRREKLAGRRNRHGILIDERHVRMRGKYHRQQKEDGRRPDAAIKHREQTGVGN